MQFAKYINNYLLCTSILVLSQIANASTIEKRCGQYMYQVKILSGDDEFEKRFELYYYKKNKKKTLFYKSESGIEIITACIKNGKKENLMLFQDFCGGNGCPEDMYGLFNPNTENMIIKPSDYPGGNNKQIKEIIGYSLPSLIYDKRTFCCDKNQY